MSCMILQKLIVQGLSYRRTIQFNDDFTIISGEKTSGKSLVLSLIDYCLGKKSKIDLTVQTELDTFCDQVFLELKINDEFFTLSRLLKEKQDKISIYFCAFENLDEYTSKTLDIKEAMKFMMQKLNINEYQIIRHQKHSTKKELDTVSFRDIFRYVYIHQHALGTGDFLEKKTTFKSIKNPHAFKMMFNLVDIDKDALNEQLVEVQNNIEETRKEILGLKSYLKDKDAEDRIDLQAKSDKLNKMIESQRQDKLVVIQNSKSNSNNENKMYIKLKKDLEGIANELFDLHREKRHLQLSVNSKKLLLEEYGIEQKEVEETLELNYKIVIPDQSIECPLCNSKVSSHTHAQVHRNADTEKMLHKVKREITNKINLVSSLIDSEMENIEDIDKEIARLSRKQIIFNEAISEFAKVTDVPFLSQIDSINSMINRLIKDREMVKEELRIHHKIDEKEKHIEDLQSTETRLKGEIAALQISDEDRNKIFKFLNAEYKHFMGRLKYNTTGETFIHPEQYIPFYNGASVYAHESGGLLECMQLSYLGAILRSKEAGFAPGHPGFLLLDSLSKYVGTLKQEDQQTGEQGEKQTQEEIAVEKQTEVKEKNKINDPEVYEEFYKILIELSANHQIILVENTPPKEFNRMYTKYTFLNGEHGLINQEMNEIKQDSVS
ncbi:hypothetical protein E8L90_23720 [Brevibacillus antibioticus]|uniref:Rad50/SbcC-type AAA domain-containing protein n=1 Tax=Brevibacillus antibioticus TaxID=2570228 RepID=A0A4U2YDJ3_9BACL|nr:hypothetical protein [Brevibacillus antibioticus]TKI58152.1 hypothetical protein E8L90_23720 [Brevibacillus antibioticus]